MLYDQLRIQTCHLRIYYPKSGRNLPVSTCRLLAGICHLLITRGMTGIAKLNLKKNPIMYAETHRFQNRFTKGLQWACAALGVVQLAALGSAETGLPWTSFSTAFHVFLLLTAIVVGGLAARTGLALRISAKGWEFRYSPFHWQYRHLGWEEIRHARLLKPDEAPLDAPYGFPGGNFTRTYLLTHRRYAVLRLDLVNGTQLFISTTNPAELLEYLQRAPVPSEHRAKTMVA